MLNTTQLAISLILVVFVMLGMASYSERNSPESAFATLVLIALILTLLVLLATIIGSIVMEVRTIRRERKKIINHTNSVVIQRSNRLRSHFLKEAPDIDQTLAAELDAVFERLEDRSLTSNYHQGGEEASISLDAL